MRTVLLCLATMGGVLFAPSVPQAATTLNYEYGANGSMVSGDGKYFEYNDANQLVRVRHGNASGPVIAEYVYDHTGQRIKKVENGVTTYYVGKHFEQDVAGEKQTTTTYWFANGERVGKKESGGQVSYYHLDHLDGINIISDTSGNIHAQRSYYPFGDERLSADDRYGFVDKEKEVGSELYYYESRYYSENIKHFISSDTFTTNPYDPQSNNRYSYVRNNPLKYVDPSGYFVFDKVSSFIGGKVSSLVDKAVTSVSNTSLGKSVGDFGGDVILNYLGAPAEGASPEYWASLADGLDHSYDVSKKAFGKAITGPFSGGTIADLGFILAEEGNFLSDNSLEFLKMAKSIYDLHSGIKDVKNLGKEFHFNRKDYKTLSKILGKKDYSLLRKTINDNKDLYHIIGILEKSDKAASDVYKKYNK